MISDYAPEFLYVWRFIESRQETQMDETVSSKCSLINFNLAGRVSKHSSWHLVGSVEMSLCVVDLVVVLCGGTAVRRGDVSVDGRWDTAAVLLVVVGQRQAQ